MQYQKLGVHCENQKALSPHAQGYPLVVLVVMYLTLYLARYLVSMYGGFASRVPPGGAFGHENKYLAR